MTEREETGGLKRVILLAAGLGSRLRPITDHMPKCMVPVSGRPILEHNIIWLKRFGITQIVINLHYLPDIVQDYFGDGSRWGVNITYSIEEEILGTSGGVKRVASYFQDNPFLVWYGDNLSHCDIGKLFTLHQTRGGLATMALCYRENVSASGIVGLGIDDRIIAFLEKPESENVFSHWVNAGIYVLDVKVLELIPAQKFSDFGRDIFPEALKKGFSLYGYRLSQEEGLWWIDTQADLKFVEDNFPLKGIKEE